MGDERGRGGPRPGWSQGGSDEPHRERTLGEQRGLAVPGRYRFQPEQSSRQRFGPDYQSGIQERSARARYGVQRYGGSAVHPETEAQRWVRTHEGGPGRRESRGPRNYQRSDERIREDLAERLIFRQEIDSTDVSIEVRSGVVMLEGSVPARWMKHRIEDIAAATRGVHDVQNRIRVVSAGAGLAVSAAPARADSAAQRTPQAQPQSGADAPTPLGTSGPSSRPH